MPRQVDNCRGLTDLGAVSAAAVVSGGVAEANRGFSGWVFGGRVLEFEYGVSLPRVAWSLFSHSIRARRHGLRGKCLGRWTGAFVNKISAVWKARASSQVAIDDIPQGNSQEPQQLSTPPSLDFQNCEPNKTCFFINDPDSGFMLWQKKMEEDTEKGRASISSLEVGDHNGTGNSAARDPTDNRLAWHLVGSCASSIYVVFNTVKPHLRKFYFWFQWFL